MRILICTGIYPPDIGGPATYSKILADELPKCGIGIEVLSFGEVRKFSKLIRHFIYFLEVLKRGRKADIIFAQDPVSVGLPSCLAAKILRKKFVLKIVGDYAWEQGSQRFGVKDLLDDFLDKKYCWQVEFLREIQKFIAKNAAKIVVPSEYLKGVINKWGIGKEKINVIYNAVEKNHQDHVLANRNFILSIGRLMPWKGFGTLIEIISELPEEIRLMIIGKGPEEKNLKLKIGKLKLENRVEFFDMIPHEKVGEYFAKARIFVLNTAYEGLPHAVLEAMTFGIPVITTNVGGNPEIIINGKNGFLVGYNNKEDLRNAIIDLWDNDVLRDNFVKQAKIDVKKFSLQIMINKTISLFDSL